MEWQDDPGDFQPQISVNGSSDFIRRLALILENEINYRRADHHAKNTHTASMK